MGRGQSVASSVAKITRIGLRSREAWEVILCTHVAPQHKRQISERGMVAGGDMQYPCTCTGLANWRTL